MPYIEKIPNFKMNVNISSVQLLRRDFPDELNAFLAREQVDPRFLALEITETAFINNSVLASEQVAKLKSIGVDIQLDDFGTGYSSLSFINLFQVDALKIERQFIGTLNHGRQADLVRAIIALGENMGLEIIAEGIETEEQLNFLIDGGCHLGQGFYFSQAVVAREAQKLLASFVTKIETQNLSPTPVSMS